MMKSSSPPLTFIAPVNAIRYVDAWPVFIDAEPDYWQMDPARVKDFMEHGCDWKDGSWYNRRTGRRVSKPFCRFISLVIRLTWTRSWSWREKYRFER